MEVLQIASSGKTSCLPGYLILTWISFLLSQPQAGPKAYYFSRQGNDRNDGQSAATAWKTLSRLEKVRLQPGDSILLRGGDQFTGSILLDDLNGGDQKTVITSYGRGRPVIQSIDSPALRIRNGKGIRISGLLIRGKGVNLSPGSGIEIAVTRPGTFGSIEIENCEARGFHDYGLLIQSSQSGYGLDGIVIRRCRFSGNGEAGLGSLAVYPEIVHRNFRIVSCIAHHNRGLVQKTNNHSGNGIVLSGVNGFSIDSCEAFENGADCRSTGGGPVGIWVWNCRQGVIENSHAHHNHAGSSIHDGGGFDIDGGASDCVIRNCFSHDNEGAGYLVCEFGSPRGCANNLVTGNRSVHDGLKNGYGAITIAGAGSGYRVINTVFSRNHLVVKNKKVRDGIPAAFYFVNADLEGIRILDNEIEVDEGSLLLRTDSLLAESQAVFSNNRFRPMVQKKKIRCVKCDERQLSEWTTSIQ